MQKEAQNLNRIFCCFVTFYFYYKYFTKKGKNVLENFHTSWGDKKSTAVL